VIDLLLNRRRLLTEPDLLGRWGEKRAEKYLRRQGLRILARNYDCRLGELDLIMVDTDRTLVFVEVRTRADETFGPAESSITHTKKAKLARTARHFLAVHDIDNRPFRFDVVVIVLGQKGKPQIRHYKNAFVP